MEHIRSVWLIVTIFNNDTVLRTEAIGPLHSMDECQLEFVAQSRARRRARYEWLQICRKTDDLYLIGDLMYGKSAR